MLANKVSSKTKTCPYCAEEIKAAAIICRYCKKEMPPEPVNAHEDFMDTLRQNAKPQTESSGQ